MIRNLACVVVAILAFAAEAPAQLNVPEPDGYRTEDYRAPVPATLKGARVLATAEAEAIWRSRHGSFHRRAAACAKAAKSSRGHGVAR